MDELDYVSKRTETGIIQYIQMLFWTPLYKFRFGLFSFAWYLVY